MNLKDEVLETKEWALLLACLQRDHDPRSDDQKAALAKSITDWKHLFLLADFHSLLPALYWGIKRTDTFEATSIEFSFLREHFEASRLRNLLAIDTFLHCKQLLAAEGIDAVIFKGLILAADVYEHLALRQFGDIDVLVRQQRMPQARAILQEHGYRPVYPAGMLIDPQIQRLSLTQTQIYDRYYHELTLQSRDNLMQIDLHWGLSPRLYPTDPDLTTIWEGVRTASLNGHDVLTLSHEHQLLNTCIHATKDRWRSLKWVVDIDRLIRSKDNLDWVHLKALASTSQSERILTFGMRLSQLLLDTPIPTSGSISEMRMPSQSDLSAILKVLFRPDKPKPRALPCLGINPVYLRLCGGWSLRMRYLYRALTLPRPEDEVMFGLRQQQYPLWRLRRPFWILGRCLSRTARPRPGATPFRG